MLFLNFSSALSSTYASCAVAAEELRDLSRRAGHFVCVCDDLFRGGGTYEDWTERYRRGLALVCRRLAAEFDTVCEVTAGIPHCYKGSLDR